MQVKIHSKRLLNEFKTFIFNGNRVEHANGYHDDLIFAFGIGLLMRDTEYENVFKSKEYYKAMLDSISYVSGGINYNSLSNTDGAQRNIQKTEKGDDDLSWLLAPTSS